MVNPKIIFPRDVRSDFFADVRKKVKAYFKENNISRYGDRRMYIKTAVLIGAYVGSYTLIITRISDLYIVNLMLWILLGLSLAGIGFSIMHDASHGSYSKNKKLNRILANIMIFIGGSEFTWDIQHNQLHHNYTNVDGIDEDINPGSIMRFSPHKKRYWIHRFQHIYAWFFYGFMTLSWSTTKDFKQAIKYKGTHESNKSNVSFSSRIFRLVAAKLLFHLITLILPLILLPDPWYVTVLFVFTMHFVAGLLLACVFQPAHVMPTCEFPTPNEEGNMENNWAIHQLLTTANFAPNSKLLSWYVGGLNFQIEHHLFPNICHVHHRAISKFVKETAKEYNLPYNVQPTFLKAILEHGKMLKMLGRTDYVPVES